MLKSDANVAGVNQAVQRPGGNTPVNKDARGKSFTNSIRLSLGHLNKFKQRTDGKAIC